MASMKELTEKEVFSKRESGSVLMLGSPTPILF